MPMDLRKIVPLTTTHADAIDVTDVDCLLIDTTAGNAVIGGLSGGVVGQYLDIIKKTAANTLTLEHQESTGTQKFYFDSAADQVTAAVKTGYGFRFDGTDWVCCATPCDIVT